MGIVRYQVIPLKGVGPVLLGMSRAEVHLVMGTQPKSFKPYASPTLADAYHNGCFQVFFDVEDRVEYIELSSLGTPFVAMYKGREIFQLNANSLIDLISEDAPFDTGKGESGYSYVFPQIELSVWRPAVPENDNDLEGQHFSTIGIGKRGYYSNMR